MFAFLYICLLSTLYSLLLLSPLFLEQSLYEIPTGPSEESNDDGYYYAEDLNVEPTNDMYDMEATYGSWDE